MPEAFPTRRGVESVVIVAVEEGKLEATNFDVPAESSDVMQKCVAQHLYEQEEQSSLLLGGHQSLVLAISYRRLQLKAQKEMETCPLSSACTCGDP